MELKMTTALDKLIPLEIAFNFDELKTEISEKLEFYKHLVVTEDAISGAKKDRAALNNLTKALDAQRLSQQREYMKPFDDYKSKVDEIIGMIREPVETIDRQIKGFEEVRKEEKRKSIETFFRSNVHDLCDLLPLEKIWNDKWLNATFKLMDATQEIIAAIDKVKNDIGIIRAMRCDCEQQMIDKYLQSLSMSDALAEKTRFEERQKKLAEYQQKQEEIRIAASAPVPVQKTFEPPVVKTYTEETEPTECLDFRVWVTPTQKRALKQFLTDNKIKLGRVE